MLPVFIINLDRRPDRWQAMSAQLNRLGIKAKRIPAIDGTSIQRQDEYEELTNLNPVERILLPTEEACLLSHCRAMNAFMETGAPAALIMEDDVEVSADMRACLGSLDWWPRTSVKIVKTIASTIPASRVLLRSAIGQTAGVPT